MKAVATTPTRKHTSAKAVQLCAICFSLSGHIASKCRYEVSGADSTWAASSELYPACPLFRVQFQDIIERIMEGAYHLPYAGQPSRPERVSPLLRSCFMCQSYHGRQKVVALVDVGRVLLQPQYSRRKLKSQKPSERRLSRP